MRDDLTEGQKLADGLHLFTRWAVIRFIITRLVVFTTTITLWFFIGSIFVHETVHSMILFICTLISTYYIIDLYHGVRRYILMYYDPYDDNATTSTWTRFIKWINGPVIPLPRKKEDKDGS